MNRARTAIALTLSLCILASPLSADIIRSSAQRASDSSAAPLPPALAAADLSAEETAGLSASDLAYFSADPARVQVVGELGTMYWYEKAFGYLAIVGVVVLIATIIVNNRDT